MDIRHLRQVVAIHQHGSFARAAHVLGVSQPTLSKSMARIEDEVGLELFQRGASGAVATPMGLHVIARAERILADAALLNREVELLASGEQGRAVIGVGSVIAPGFLPRLTQALAGQFPQLEARLIVEPRTGLMNGLRSGSYDMVLIATNDDLDAGEFHLTELGEEPVVAVVCPDHPLARAGPVALSVLLQQPLATSIASHPFELHRVLQLARDAKEVRPRYVSNDFSVLRTLALCGAAVALGPRHSFQADCRSGELISLEVSIPFHFRLTAAMTFAASRWPVLTQITARAVEILSDEFSLSRCSNAPSSATSKYNK